MSTLLQRSSSKLTTSGQQCIFVDYDHPTENRHSSDSESVLLHRSSVSAENEKRLNLLTSIIIILVCSLISSHFSTSATPSLSHVTSSLFLSQNLHPSFLLKFSKKFKTPFFFLLHHYYQ
ncbi:hypothetical protein L5515_014491 [Caenorhabditis briggsae]|uniref:Uncharacterized protein n=1 Tax=Caenorhabditis briggsae TaxID=6238 RepID=A0AAE9DL58_CAEBR|nr:hypothetical protein L3Y34_018367 [Caenorhabditis briggsae]UMM18408.1 hypothetical protein L5515_014491 [Caenorhabditis briggsae]